MNRDELRFHVWLTNTKFIGPESARGLLNIFKSPDKVFYADEDSLKSAGLKSNQVTSILQNRSLDLADRILETCEDKGIKILTINDSRYPSHTRLIKDIPTLLYYRGSLDRLNSGVGIVGTRRCTQYGKKVTRDIVDRLKGYNLSIISGMAKSIDAYAHTAAINNNMKTMAFLGNGVDICYPSEHMKLMEGIIENGAVISEYPPGERPSSHTFPRRNRLIAAFSKRLIVVEAGEKSGSLTTASYALKYNTPVFAVPGSIYSDESIGCISLIEKGAKIFNLNNIPLLETKAKKALEIEDDVEKQIIKALEGSSKSIDELLLCLDLPVDYLLEKISIMELEGKISMTSSGGFSPPGVACLLGNVE
ncbi:MAG: DNA-processing protein DprA [Niameybacter sp.]